MAKAKTLADFGGDQDAYDKYLLDEQSKSTTNAEEAPQQDTIEGLVVGISDKAIKFKNGNFGRFLTVDGEPNQILISEPLFQNNQAYLQKGMRIKVEVERRVKDVTGYTDTNKESKTFGQWLTHSSTGLGFNRVVLSAGEAEKLAQMNDKRQELENKYGAREQSIAKVIDKVASVVGDDKQALGTALAGAFTALRD